MKYSNKEFDKLGDRIRNDKNHISEHDYEMLQELRTSYKSSLSLVFNKIEEQAHKVDPNCVCTFRIKRIESIISKIMRFPKMRISRAEDIAGCRCILSKEKQVYELYNRLLKKKNKLPFEIKSNIKDYITNPKESGYKSLHMIVNIRGENKRIEVQLRSLEHHNWATLVETTDLLYDKKLKEIGRASDNELFRLHLLLSKNSLSYGEIYEIADIVIKYDYIKKLGEVFARNYIEVRKHWNALKLQNMHYFLISADKSGKPEIRGFAQYNDAENAYFNEFIANKEENKNIVLTHLHQTNYAKISVAYSNYFLTYNNTMIKVLKYLSLAVRETYRRNKLKGFTIYYKAFLDIMLFWMDKQFVEIQSFQKDKNIARSRMKHLDWENSIVKGIYNFREIFRCTQKDLSFNIFNVFAFYIMKSNYKKFIVKVDEITKRESGL
jgi:ppGpp synthetase/RelA/SpoT-type nucleotidyltranferase